MIKYLLSAQKSYNYNNNILSNTTISLGVTFTANVPDPEVAGFIPYYRSPDGLADEFFQNLLLHGFEFNNSQYEPALGENKDNQFCTWTETYQRIEVKKSVFDIELTINMPAWRIRFIDFIDDINESRRFRQTYGLNFLGGTINIKSNKLTTWKDIFTNWNEFVIDNVSTTQYWQNETLYNISINWKTYDLTKFPVINEDV